MRLQLSGLPKKVVNFLQIVYRPLHGTLRLARADLNDALSLWTVPGALQKAHGKRNTGRLAAKKA